MDELPTPTEWKYTFPPDLAQELQVVLLEEGNHRVSLDDAAEIGGALVEFYSLIMNLNGGTGDSDRDAWMSQEM